VKPPKPTRRPAPPRPDRPASRGEAPERDSAAAAPARKGKDDWKLKSPRRKFRESRQGGGKPPSATDDGLSLLYGYHAVREALANPKRRFRRLLATENGAMRLSEDGALPSSLKVEIVKAEAIGRRLSADAVHQGMLLEAEALAPISLDAIPAKGCVLALDQVTDPHNVGAILRSCAAFAVDALLLTERHSPEMTGVLAKAASGALEHVPIAAVRNLSAALEALKARGFAVIGFDSEAPAPLEPSALGRPLVLVMGAEGKGLRQKTRATCSAFVRLDMPGAIRSLNVSNAAAIALYAASLAAPAGGAPSISADQEP